MSNRFRYSPAAILVTLALASPGSAVSAALEVLKSSALRLELTTSPYSFQVREAKTGQVLLSHSALAFTQKRHAAASATEVRKTSRSLRATLLLAGGAGQAEVAFSFSRPEAIQVLITYGSGDPGEIFQEFSDQGEHYYGIWQYPFGGNIDNRGADRDFLGFRGLPIVINPNARAPFYVTSRKYGLYVETTAQGHYAIAKDGKTSFWFRDSPLKYHILYGPTYADILKRYNALAGPAFLPPTWAFGSIWWRDDHHADLRGVSNAQEKVMDDAAQLARLRIPASAMWLDRPFGTGTMGWGNMDFDKSFPDPAGMVRELKDRGLYLFVWIANRVWNKLAEEGAAKGYLFPTAGRFGGGPAADIRIPEAYRWWEDKLDAFVKLGIRGYKIDRGEEGELPDSFQNLHAILYPKLAAEGLAAAYGNDYFTFARNVNDTSRKYTAVWNGDTRATFEALAVSVKNALRCGAFNFPMWGSDTGGYIGRPDKELFARWLEFSAYSPMMEVLLGPRRTIWQDFDSELVEIAQKQTRAHHDLIPYTRSCMYQATQTGVPIMRSLIFAYPNDDSLHDAWDQYLYGGEILVAPVTTPKAVSREVYLPAGRWMNYHDRTTVHRGPARISVAAPLGTIPLFVREGAIIPRGDILKANNNWDTNWAPKLRIEIFPATKGASFFDYFTGRGVERITASSRPGNITVAFGDLGLPGSLEIYCEGIRRVKKNGVTLRHGEGYSYDQAARKLTVSFTGATKLTIQGATGRFGS